MTPKYDINKIKFSLDGGTYNKAIGLYEEGKVTHFEDLGRWFKAKVLGTSLYDVEVSAERFDEGDCTCYLGQNGTLCKHMIAVAIHGIYKGDDLSESEKAYISELKINSETGEITEEQLGQLRKEITASLRYIKPYNGPSRVWFSYQASLFEGCNRLTAIVNELPVSLQTARIIVDLLIRLDRKLMSGVDDSDGAVGGFMSQLVEILEKYPEIDPKSIEAFKRLEGKETVFGWERPLLQILASKRA